MLNRMQTSYRHYAAQFTTPSEGDEILLQFSDLYIFYPDANLDADNQYHIKVKYLTILNWSWRLSLSIGIWIKVTYC